MKIAVSSTAPGIDAEVSPIFGRCNCFVVVDTATQEVKILENPAQIASGGAGIQSAQLIVQEGVDAVISGNVGPNAMQVLSAAGVKTYLASGGDVAAAVAALQEGKLDLQAAPSVHKDYGKDGPAMGRGGAGHGLERGRGA